MAEPFLSEVRIFSFGFAPRGWATCNGQLLPINQNQALFALLGTTYGGNGQTNFGLPDLQGRVALHEGAGHTLGQVGGEADHTLTAGEMPAHNHIPVASANNPSVASASNNFWSSNTGFTAYGTLSDLAMAPEAVSNVGGNQSHHNMSPFLTLNFCIALQGIFPSQN